MSDLTWFKRLWLGSVLSVFAFVAACTGPRPSASAPVVLPKSSPEAPYRVSLVVQNQGSGEGQIEVNVRLHEKNRNETYFADKKVDLRGHENVHLIVSISAPPGDYAAEVDAVYPPG